MSCLVANMIWVFKLHEAVTSTAKISGTPPPLHIGKSRLPNGAEDLPLNPLAALHIMLADIA